MTRPSHQQPTSILQALRLLMPNRPLTLAEAKQRAELQATKLLELTGIQHPSVSLEAISELPRVRIVLDDELPSSGLAHWDGQSWVITVNGTEHPNRQRFSAMHEFKHCLDHPFRHSLQSDREMSDSQFAERICDYFAACVLMPRGWVKSAYYGGTQTIEALASLFEVSTMAMKYRLDQLGLSRGYECRSTSQIRPKQRYHRRLPHMTGART